MPEGMKWCPDCAEVKEMSDFGRNAAARTGVNTYCKPCHNKRTRASKAAYGGERTYHLKRRYGITAEQPEAMLVAQNGLCALCGEAPAVHVDHDHSTGAVRDLLCFNCNGGLGQFRDDPDLLRAAAEYVERHAERAREASGGDTDRERTDRGTAPPSSCVVSPGMARWRAMQSKGPASV
ncbi:hypothetical protein A7K94_0205190 [Modestobacter sp. VKM Ac-2676]|nr:hypothetical protein A7K94_0205190 [Modestobacter sp. VKM Ac-2676]